MNAASHLDSVTVYARGALCTRRAKLALEPGVRHVRVTGLPLSLQAGSLRARVEGGARSVLDVRPGFDAQLPPEADVPAERKAIEAASAKAEALQRELQRVEREITELQKLKPTFPAARPGEPPRSAPVGALLKAAEFVDSELARKFERRRALRQELLDAQNALELHTRRLAEASGALKAERARLSRTALVTLSEGAAADVELAVEYFVPGARWAPSYALRLEQGMAAGALELRASVAQNTGEDWTDVKLSLSTAALDRRTALPELKSLRIGRAQAAPRPSGWREPPPGLDELFEGFDAAVGPKPALEDQRKGGLRQEKERKTTAEVAAIVDKPLPPEPLPPPMAAPAPSGAPMMKMRAAPPMMARSGAFAVGGGGPRRSASRGDDFEDDVTVEGAAFGELADDGGVEEETAVHERAPAEAPAPASALEPAVDLLDYGNLFMPAPSAGRGRLRPGSDPAIAMFGALSVQVNVVMAFVAQITERAIAVERLALPTRAVAPGGGSFDYRYDCAGRVDVPSTGKWATVSVGQADVGLKAEYACVPSVEQKVYRTVRIHNRSPHALLRGPVDVTLGDEFLLTADLPLVAPGAADARLGLGVEEAIKVARKTHFKETSGGLLGGSTVLPHDVEIELNNRLGQSAFVEVRERVPFSIEDQVKIEEARVEPAWEKDEALRDGAVVRGARAWRVTLAAGEKKTLTAQYVVRIPADKMLVGGNRRS